MNDEKYLQKVREQYENYPYPKRDPEKEKQGLYFTSTEHLGKISHYGFNGKRDLRQGGRCLVAGGGTGDAVLYLAEQLRDTDATVVYVDLSQSSMDIAKQRAEIRGLNNIEWHQKSILELPDMDVGSFDFINCCGVLHHLADPSEGLKALSSVLKNDGCMAIMVYATYGRTGIYYMQELMRQINGDEENLQQCVDNTHAALKELPEDNWYKRDEARWIVDLEELGDIEVYDLFLHSQDRSYTVPEIYQWLEGCELELVDFSGFTGQKLKYETSQYFSNSSLLEKITVMPLGKRQEIAELTNGCIKTHTFYVSKNTNTIASLEDMDLVPYYSFNFIPGEVIYKDMSNNPDKPMEVGVGEGVDNLKLNPGKYTAFLFKHINGLNTVAEIIELAKKDILSISNVAPDNDALMMDLKVIFEKFNSYELMFMRDSSINPYKNHDQLVVETKSRHTPKININYSFNMDM